MSRDDRRPPPKPRPGEEADPRFPGGRWTGFWLQPSAPGKHRMELEMRFEDGRLTAEGRDRVGPFTFDGRYDVVTGRCEWVKRYAGSHVVAYAGASEGEPMWLWGVWSIAGGASLDKGGFHLWPEWAADPTAPAKAAKAEVPAESGERSEPRPPRRRRRKLVPAG